MTTFGSIQHLLFPHALEDLKARYTNGFNLLQEGVLHQYDGKVWLIRLGIPDGQVERKESIREVFFLVHSTRKTYAFRCFIIDGVQKLGALAFGQDKNDQENLHQFFFNILRSEPCDTTQMAPKIPFALAGSVRAVHQLENAPDSLFKDFQVEPKESDVDNNYYHLNNPLIHPNVNDNDGISTSTKIVALCIVLALAGEGLFATYKIVQYVRSPRKIGV